MSDSLQPHGLQHTRLPCPSPTPRACSNSCLLSQWCHPTISSSALLFSSCLQSFPTSGSFPMSQLCSSGGQRIGTLASASVLPVNIQDWFPLGKGKGKGSKQRFDLLCILRTLKSLLQHHSSKPSIIQHIAFFMVQLSEICTWLLEKTTALTIQTFVHNVMSLLFNMLPGFVIACLPKSRCF